MADRTGRPITSRSVLAAIRSSLRVPTLVSNDAMLGQGVLGGALYRVEDLGASAARTTLRVLEGTAPMPCPCSASPPRRSSTRVSWSGSASRSRASRGHDAAVARSGIWEQYRVWILAGLSVLLLQSALIAGLLAERRRRLASQEQLAERLRVQALVADISTDFANLRGRRLDTQMESSLERVGVALGTEDCAIWTWRWRDE